MRSYTFTTLLPAGTVSEFKIETVINPWFPFAITSSKPSTCPSVLQFVKIFRIALDISALYKVNHEKARWVKEI